MNLLEIDSVNFSFGNKKILSNIYLKVETGEVVRFLGRNGCGKSTLLKVLFGTAKGESQSVKINKKYEEIPYKTRKIMLAPQESLFPGFITSRKAIGLYQSNLSKLSTDEIVANHMKMSFAEMSVGIRKHIEILIILYSPCQFVLLDEPFSFLAPVLVEKLIPIIKDISKDKGILLIDNQYRSILEVSDRLYLLRNESIYPISDEEQLRDLGYIN
ncbi:MAG: lipopolysaccharide export system ATP-binding protein [Cyclobacteriaceae bacterium]|jgi:lipopolysaccharide export system ATP-binding protein